MANNPYQDAVADSDREIMAFALKPELTAEEAINEAEQNDQLIEEMSQVEGFDGEHLSNEEGMARAIQGDDANPYYISDRPLQYEFELDVARKLMQEEAKNADLIVQNHQLRQQYDPAMREQAEMNRMQFLDQHGLMAIDDAKANAFLQQQAMLEQQRTAAFNRNGWESVERARAKYGRAFDEVDKNFERLDPNNPMARTAAQHIYHADDPGEALMNAADTIASLVNPQNGWQRHPYLGRSRQDAPRSSRREFPRDPDEQMNSGWSEREQEQEIFDAWKDY